MATDERPSIGSILSRAFSSTWHGFLNMPMLFISSYFGTGAALFAASYFGNPIATSSSAVYGAGSVEAGLTIIAKVFLAYLAITVFLAPVAVAIHRLIIRGEITKGLVSIVPARTRTFIFWLVLIELVRLLYLVPSAISSANSSG